MPENYNSDDNTIHENKEDEVESISKKERTLYSQGGSVNRKRKLTGVHRLIMLTLRGIEEHPVETEKNDTETCFSSESYRESNEACVQETSAKCLKLKTYGDLRNSYKKFRSFGKNKNFARDCHSTINPPLFPEDDEVYVIIRSRSGS
ncbi:unnamed protein product [Brassicogethes aeneus]|uniref:Uncharacterized protein n=1 Tax=Brassicogethes aeneus TaxID=1431903 RepID=A0A9P0B213_BRAAE|nr:unnamed protein product [Brassicogethes aeneus]